MTVAALLVLAGGTYLMRLLPLVLHDRVDAVDSFSHLLIWSIRTEQMPMDFRYLTDRTTMRPMK